MVNATHSAIRLLIPGVDCYMTNAHLEKLRVASIASDVHVVVEQRRLKKAWT